MGGATWYLSRLARGPDIVWDRHNNPRKADLTGLLEGFGLSRQLTRLFSVSKFSEPWNDVKQGYAHLFVLDFFRGGTLI